MADIKVPLPKATNDMLKHVGHTVKIVAYQLEFDPQTVLTVTLECVDCGCILFAEDVE